MKDFSFKALIVFIIVLISGLILVPLLAPKTIIDESTVNEYNAFVFLAEGEFNYDEFDGYFADIYEYTDNFFDLLVLEIYINNVVYTTNFISYGLNYFNVYNQTVNIMYTCLDNVAQIIVHIEEYLGSISYRVWGVGYDNIL